MSAFRIITAALLIIGGLNWGLVGFFQYDLVAALFGGDSMLARTIYSLIGLSAIYQIFSYPWDRKTAVISHQDRFKRVA